MVDTFGDRIDLYDFVEVLMDAARGDPEYDYGQITAFWKDHGLIAVRLHKRRDPEWFERLRIRKITEQEVMLRILES